jgi:hypothetical protein
VFGLIEALPIPAPLRDLVEVTLVGHGADLLWGTSRRSYLRTLDEGSSGK